MPTAVLIGTLDTKGPEHQFVRDLLVSEGVDVIVVDVGVLGDPRFRPDVPAAEVSSAAGVALQNLRFGREGSDTRRKAVEVMGLGAAKVIARLFAEGRCDGVLGLGGSGGSAIISDAMRALPFGVPKLLVSTMAAGDVGAYVGSTDLTIMHSVTDIAGLNALSRRIFANAAGALAGMIRAPSPTVGERADRPAVGVTMLGVTTAGALRVVERLSDAGYDPVVFHAVGSGGRALESLLADGTLAGVVDLTVKELTDEQFGGIFHAGPERLRTAGRRGIPQVVVPGAIEVLNFGALPTVPRDLLDPARPLVQHNAQVTALRLTREELVHMAGVLADRVNRATGPTAVLIPTRGFDSYAVAGGPFEDGESPAAFTSEFTDRLRPGISVTIIDRDINDPVFADAVAAAFVELHEASTPVGSPALAAGKPAP